MSVGVIKTVYTGMYNDHDEVDRMTREGKEDSE